MPKGWRRGAVDSDPSKRRPKTERVAGRAPKPSDVIRQNQELMEQAQVRQNIRDMGGNPDEPAPGTQTSAAESQFWDKLRQDQELNANASAFQEPDKDVEQFIVEQVNWVRRTGATPLEFLVRAYRNPLYDPQDRIAAARAAMDFVHKRMPKTEIVRNPDGELREATIREKLLDRVEGLARQVGAAEAAGPSSPGPKPAKR